MTGSAARRCPACGAELRLVQVHGHGQCAACGTNVAPCCSGAGEEVDDLEAGAAPVATDVLVEILTERGPQLEQDLLNEFALRTGCGWSVGRTLLDAARTAGLVERSAGVFRVAEAAR